MAKWADYLISKVQYDIGENHIVKVMRHVDNGDTVGSGEEVTRSTVVNDLERGITYETIVLNSATQKYERGAKVRTVVINRHTYIRTDADATAKDNLGSLPRF